MSEYENGSTVNDCNCATDGSCDCTTDNSCGCNESKKLCSMLSELCGMRLTDSMDMSLKIQKNDGSTCLDKQLKMGGSCNLLLMLGIGAALIASLSLLCAVCTRIKK